MKKAEDILKQMRYEMPFMMSESLDPYILEAMNIFANQPKWIPVSDRLPEQSDGLFSDRVLVELDNGFQITAYYDYELKQWTPSYQQIIAWQNLPSPYKPE